MNLPDLLSSLFFIVFAVLVCAASINLKVGTISSPEPGFLPFWSGAVLCTLAVILAIVSISKKRVGRKAMDFWKGMKWHKVIFVSTSLLIYAIFLSKIGYLICTFCLLTFLFGIIKRSRLWILVVSALITVLATYVVFDIWLQVSLPKGVYGF